MSELEKRAAKEKLANALVAAAKSFGSKLISGFRAPGRTLLRSAFAKPAAGVTRVGHMLGVGKEWAKANPYTAGGVAGLGLTGAGLGLRRLLSSGNGGSNVTVNNYSR